MYQCTAFGDDAIATTDEGRMLCKTIQLGTFLATDTVNMWTVADKLWPPNEFGWSRIRFIEYIWAEAMLLANTPDIEYFI